MVWAIAAPGTRIASAATVATRCFFIGFFLPEPARPRAAQQTASSDGHGKKPCRPCMGAPALLLRRLGLSTLMNCPRQADAGRCRHRSLRLFLRVLSRAQLDR